MSRMLELSKHDGVPAVNAVVEGICAGGRGFDF